MTTAYSNLLGLALPVTGELSGTWGDTVNDYITKYLDDAIANAQVISGSQTAVTLSKTTGTALVAAGSGSTGSAQYALIRCTGNPASTLTITVSYSSLTNSQFSKTYLIFNSTSTNQSVVVQATTSSGTSTGVTITAGERALIAWNGTDFVKIATQSGTGEFVTVDTTNLEVTNIKAKDGTAAATIADSTGAITVSTLLNVDNLRLDGNTLSSTDSNGNVVLAPNGTGDVQLDADTVRVGDSAAAVTLTSNGAGALTVTTGGAADLILNTNSGTNSGSITIGNGTNGNITVATNGTGDFYVDADTVRIGDSNANATITTNGTGDLILNTNSGTNSGSITIEDGVNGNIIIAPNGTGQVQITNAALDLTTIEVTNIKAKDGTASMTLADTTGIITLSATAGTANGVLYLNGSRAVTSGSALTFDGSTFNVTGAASVTGTNSLSLQRPVVPSFLGQGAPAITWQFYSTGTTYTVGASIQGLADAAWTSTSAPTSIRMYTVPSGSTSLSERLRIAAGGQVNIGGNFDSTNNTLQVTGNAAIGYTTAAPTTGLIVAGNVGIGTDSPNISGGAAGSKIVTVSASAAGRNGILELNGTRSTSGDYVGYVRFFNNAAATPGADIQAIRGASDTEAVLAFATSGTERARIEAAGNLILRQSSNAANTSVSFNTTVQDALTLDSSGRLGVGTGSPAARFNVESGDILLRGGQLTIGPTAGGNGAGAIRSTLNGVLGSLIFQTEDSNAALVDRMTLDSSGNLGIGTTPTANYGGLQVVGPTSSSLYTQQGIDVVRMGVRASGRTGIILDSSDATYTNRMWFIANEGASGSLGIGRAGLDVIRLSNSGDVGIGTTNPAVKLDVVGASQKIAKFFAQSSYGQLEIGTTGANQNVYLTLSPNGTGLGIIQHGTGDVMKFDASGNLGLGVTPSAWGGSYKAFNVVGSGSLFSNNQFNTRVGNNVYHNGTNFIYNATGFATYYSQNDAAGEHRWFNAPSGTANTTTITNGVSYTIITSGNQTAFGAANNNVGTSFTANASGTLSSGTVSQNISFTQAMTLDASGNLLVGTTTTTNNLRLQQKLATVSVGNNTFAGAALTGYSGTTAAAAPVLDFNRSRGTTDGSMTVVASGDTIGYLAFRASDGTNFVDAASIRVDVDGTPGTNDMPGRIVFFTSPDGSTSQTERARITSGGYFKASSTGGYESGIGNFHEFRASANDTQTTTFSHTAASPYGIVVRYTGAAPNNTDNWFWYCDDNSSTQRASLKSNGGLYNYQANDSNLSDRREKTNFAPAGPYLSKICAIPVQTFNYIDQNMEEDPGTTLGVVAQDVQAIAPELVMESNWGTEENPKMRLSIYQTDLQYALMKCIQEQQAMIDELKAEVAALKGA